jgi:hypothetical protein
MLRVLAGLLAAGFLLCAGLLVGSGATVSYSGQTTTCAGPIVRAESQADAVVAGSDRVARGLAQECARTDTHRLRLSLLAGLAALVAGAVAASSTTDADAGVSAAGAVAHA